MIDKDNRKALIYVNNHIYKNKGMIKFIEEFYQDILRKTESPQTRISIEFTDGQNSYCEKRYSNYDIKISKQNLLSLYIDKHRVYFNINFYNLVMHEVGHALHTNYDKVSNLKPFYITNVLEDNRIERIISEKNYKVNFNILRKVLIDDSIEQQEFDDLNRPKPSVVALYLLRAYDKAKYVKKWSQSDKLIELIKNLLIEGQKATMMDKGLTQDVVKEVASLCKRISKELCKLNPEEKQDDEQDEQDKKQDGRNVREEKEETNKQQSSADEFDQEDDDDDDDDDLEEDGNNEQDNKQNNDNADDEQDEGDNEQDEGDNDQEQNQDDYADEQDDEQDGDDPLEELYKLLGQYGVLIPDDEQVNDLNELIAMIFGTEAHKEYDELDYDTEIVNEENLYYKKYDYKPFNISLMDYERQKGIRGTGLTKRAQGNTKQLNMRSYMSRNFTKETKHFNKSLNEDFGNNGLELTFHIDQSYSMAGDKIDATLDYVKNFYDKYEDKIKINLRMFGEGDSIVQREHLSSDFIFRQSNTLYEKSGATIINDFKYNGKVIVLTDGAFDKRFSKFDKLKKDAFFVIVYTDERQKEMFEYVYKDVKNKVFVSTENIKEGFETATQGLKKFL